MWSVALLARGGILRRAHSFILYRAVVGWLIRLVFVLWRDGIFPWKIWHGALWSFVLTWVSASILIVAMSMKKVVWLFRRAEIRLLMSVATVAMFACIQKRNGECGNGRHFH